MYILYIYVVYGIPRYFMYFSVHVQIELLLGYAALLARTQLCVYILCFALIYKIPLLATTTIIIIIRDRLKRVSIEEEWSALRYRKITIKS